MTNLFKDVILEAPDHIIDSSIKEMIKVKWDAEPTAIQILEVLDRIVFYGAASDFVVNVLDVRMRAELVKENQTYEQLVEQASWRNED
jgi:hypothetical protein